MSYSTKERSSDFISEGGMFYSTKAYNVGFSCAFRQWKAHSHCRFIHGYDLQFKFMFAAYGLDETGWAVDFGSLKSLKGILEETFDHKTLIAEDDPLLEYFKQGEDRGAYQLRVLPKVGCEAFAYYIAEVTDIWLKDNGYHPRVALYMVEVRENSANSAIYQLPIKAPV